MARSIYLAGPDVFLPDAREVGARKQALCAKHGFVGHFPFDPNTTDAAEIYSENCALMERSDIGLFNLTPFRGPSADVGTVFELGFMLAKGKPVHGYSCVAPRFAERVEQSHGPVQNGRDRDGHGVEPFGLYDNLMIVFATQQSGSKITVVEEKGLAAFLAFEACLEHL